VDPDALDRFVVAARHRPNKLMRRQMKALRVRKISFWPDCQNMSASLPVAPKMAACRAEARLIRTCAKPRQGA
jgi:hypothetical protein